MSRRSPDSPPTFDDETPIATIFDDEPPISSTTIGASQRRETIIYRFGCEHSHISEEFDNIARRTGCQLKKSCGLAMAIVQRGFSRLSSCNQRLKSSRPLGEGEFRRVYKGHFKDTNQDIVVKQLDKNGLQGSREFLVEGLTLSLLHHPNLVNLIGYCAYGGQRVLVYEYIPLWSLENNLLDLVPGQEPLDWITRMKIPEGVAKGLEHLHDNESPLVVYRDFKASNILLNVEYHPKLSDSN